MTLELSKHLQENKTLNMVEAVGGGQPEEGPSSKSLLRG